MADENGDPLLTPKPRSGWVFIDWSAHCSRSENMAKRLGLRLLRRHRPYSGPVSFLLKYAYQAAATSWDLLQHRPSVVWCMSPSPLTAVPAWLYCSFSGACLAIDAHTGAFEGSPWAKLRALQLFLSRQARVTTVTNPHLQAQVENAHARALLVPDVPTELDTPSPRDFGAGFHAVFVASYSADEPFEIVIEAARACPEITLWWTGKPKGKAQKLLDGAPPNVKLLGFLARDAYTSAIAGADVVLALTTRDHTMQRAAYEAIYLGTPVIVSDWPVLRENFAQGALWVNNTAEGLATCLREAATNPQALRAGARALRQHKLERWARNCQELMALLTHKEES